jgi:hypothetical protein
MRAAAARGLARLRARAANARAANNFASAAGAPAAAISALRDPRWLAAVRAAYGLPAGACRCASGRAGGASPSRPRPPPPPPPPRRAPPAPPRPAPPAASDAERLAEAALLRERQPKAINHALVAAGSADSIFGVVVAQAAHLNEVNVATAWHRLATVCRGDAGAAAAARRDARLGALEAATLALAPRLSARGAASTLWGAAALAHAPPPPLLAALLAAARAQLPRASAHALANAAWAAATLRAQHDGAAAVQLATLVAAAARAAERCLPDFSPQGLSNLLWACAAVGYHPSDALPGTLARAVAADAASFKPHELSQSAWAWAELRHDPGRKALAALDAQLASRLPHFSEQAVGNVLWAAAVLCFRPERALRAIGGAVAAGGSGRSESGGGGEEAAAALLALRADAPLPARAEAFNGRFLATLLWSLALLDAFRLPLFESAWRAAAAAPPHAFALPGLCALFQVQQLAAAAAAQQQQQQQQRRAPLLPPLNPALGAAAEAAWRAQVRDHLHSELHADVADCLRAMGVPHALERLTADGLLSIDVAIGGDEGASSPVRVALEVDGPWHFAANSRGALGHTRARDALLRARGWAVASVPFFEWAPLRNTFERKLYLRAKLRAAGCDADALAAAHAAAQAAAQAAAAGVPWAAPVGGAAQQAERGAAGGG